MNFKDLAFPTPKVAYKFIFVFGALITGGFSSVRNIERKVNRYYYQEGGVNNHPIILADQQTSPHTLILEKGFVRPYAIKVSLDAEIVGNIHLWMPGFLYVANEDYIPVRLFTFERGRISEWSTSDLEAKDPNIMVDKLTIEHTGLLEVPVTF